MEKLRCPNCGKNVDDGMIETCPACNYSFKDVAERKELSTFCFTIFIILLLIIGIPTTILLILNP